MRIFIAIPIPDEVKKKLTEITRGKLPIPYINTTNLHITLNFLGDLTEDKLKSALEIFRTAIGVGRKQFGIEFDKLINRNNQIHLTLKGNPELRKMQSDLENNFRARGFVLADRAYYPHVKLGNMHMDNKLFPERKLDNFPKEDLQKLNFTASKAALYESKLLLHHAHHKSLLEIDLV